VFSKLQFESGKMTEYEHQLFEYIFKTMAWMPDVVIYIQTPPEVCYERMVKRGRDCESGVPLDYLKSVHDKYEELAAYLIEKHSQNTKVYIVDGNQHVDKVYDDVMNIINSINN
jgi:thymidylate kinase